jgi:hypothetical protein
MKQSKVILAVSFALLAICSALAQAPNVIMTDAPSFIEPGETFQSEVHFVLPSGTPLIAYQLAVGYDPEVLEFITMEDSFGVEPELMWNDTSQDPLITGGFGRAVLCFDLEIFSPVLAPPNGVVSILRITFRVLSDTTAHSSQYTVLTDARRPDNTVFETPLVVEYYNYNILIDATNATVQSGTVTIGQPILDVPIDIKPGSFPNSINPRSRGVIPVALLGSVEFDVTDVDVMTLRFGPDEAAPRHRPHLQDTNFDGQMDLVIHFRTQETGIHCADVEATLSGILQNGQAIEGTDSVRTVGCGQNRGTHENIYKKLHLSTSRADRPVDHPSRE